MTRKGHSNSYRGRHASAHRLALGDAVLQRALSHSDASAQQATLQRLQAPHKARLEALLMLHAPERLPLLDAMLFDAVGREEELYAQCWREFNTWDRVDCPPNILGGRPPEPPPSALEPGARRVGHRHGRGKNQSVPPPRSAPACDSRQPSGCPSGVSTTAASSKACGESRGVEPGSASARVVPSADPLVQDRGVKRDFTGSPVSTVPPSSRSAPSWPGCASVHLPPQGSGTCNPPYDSASLWAFLLRFYERRSAPVAHASAVLGRSSQSGEEVLARLCSKYPSQILRDEQGTYVVRSSSVLAAPLPSICASSSTPARDASLGPQ